MKAAQLIHEEACAMERRIITEKERFHRILQLMNLDSRMNSDSSWPVDTDEAKMILADWLCYAVDDMAHIKSHFWLVAFELRTQLRAESADG